MGVKTTEYLTRNQAEEMLLERCSIMANVCEVYSDNKICDLLEAIDDILMDNLNFSNYMIDKPYWMPTKHPGAEKMTFEQWLDTKEPIFQHLFQHPERDAVLEFLKEVWDIAYDKGKSDTEDLMGAGEMTFDEWFDGQDRIVSLRCERFAEDYALGGKDRMIVWLKAAYQVGYLAGQEDERNIGHRGPG